MQIKVVPRMHFFASYGPTLLFELNQLAAF